MHQVTEAECPRRRRKRAARDPAGVGGLAAPGRKHDDIGQTKSARPRRAQGLNTQSAQQTQSLCAVRCCRGRLLLGTDRESHPNTTKSGKPHSPTCPILRSPPLLLPLSSPPPPPLSLSPPPLLLPFPPPLPLPSPFLVSLPFLASSPLLFLPLLYSLLPPPRPPPPLPSFLSPPLDSGGKEPASGFPLQDT